MVKVLIVFLFLKSFLFSEILVNDVDQNITQNGLDEKIKTLIDEESFYKNQEFIKLVFSPEEDYYRQDRVDIVKVMQTLKENGLLNLFFDKPQELKLSFKTNASPLFFVKIMGDTLRNIGYYRYVTTQSNLDASEFTWVISLKSEYATDPLILQDELQKSGASIIDIVKNSSTDWEYSIDIDNGYLNVPTLEESIELELKRSLYAHWLNVSKIQNIKIKSSFGDRWYPHITFYDKQLHLLEVLKKDKRTRTLLLVMPNNAQYIKISDMYTLKNVKDTLVLEPSGSR